MSILCYVPAGLRFFPIVIHVIALLRLRPIPGIFFVTMVSVELEPVC